MSDLKNQRVVVTGGAGFLGQAVCRQLDKLAVKDVFVPRSSEFDLTRADHVARLFDHAKPDVVIHLAAEVGGIGANRLHPGRFFYANLAMGLHLIEQARQSHLKKFVQIGTVCSYPKFCPPPFQESALWDGYPEETNAPYGVAKRALGVMLDAYHREYNLDSLMLIPVNLFGPGDNFDLQTSHVIPAMIRKFCEACDKGLDEVTCWGSGLVSREFLFVEDAAQAIVQASDQVSVTEPINLGTGREIQIADLAAMIAKICGFTGRIIWDASQPDGQPRRQLDTSRAKNLFGWQAKTSLEDGLAQTVSWWQKQLAACPPAVSAK